ncbi:MAG: hypothetical protein AB7N29_14745 [Vicinamibacterales bacterium]
MSRRSKAPNPGVMLDLWRPPKDAGDPVGCLATTYTFATGLFDEQCLARFLDIESEPNREDLSFLLEREHRLGPIYAGVLIDDTRAGVEHSYRWDVLPVSIRGGKQHAKLSLLAWQNHVRIIVTSANLTDQGYRSNYEVAASLDSSPDSASTEALEDAVQFLRGLVRLVPGGADNPAVIRAGAFLADVEKKTRRWTPQKRSTVRQQLVFTMPAYGPGRPARSSLDESIEKCRARGGSPWEAWVASPFFDGESGAGEVTTALCKQMARRDKRDLCLCVPASRDEVSRQWRIAAPKILLTIAERHHARVRVEALPEKDEDKNLRLWHAKMVAYRGDGYSALMAGSSNFTVAGMGTGARRNAEANLLTIVQHEAFAREVGQIEAVWPDMVEIQNADTCEWQGADPDREEEEQAAPPVPPGFLSATYRAGDHRLLILALDPKELPPEWRVSAAGRDPIQLLNSVAWREGGGKSTGEIPWVPIQPPEKLMVQWDGNEAFLSINVEDRKALPPPRECDSMTSDDILRVLAATDPSAAFRAWAKTQQEGAGDDADELDSAAPLDLDPLKRYDLHATFLHRVRRRARVLAQLRANLERPVGSRQALEWRLSGLIGISTLANRFLRELAEATERVDEALLTLADFLIVLREINYQSGPGALAKEDFDGVYSGFLKALTKDLQLGAAANRERLSPDLWAFWERVVTKGRP